MVTKRRLHVIFVLASTMTVLELGGCFLFVRKDFTHSKVCVTANILDNAAFYACTLVNGVLLASIMTVSLILMMVKLYKRNLKAQFYNNRIRKTPDTDPNMNRALLIALAIYISLFIPTVVCFCLRIFIDISEFIIIMDIFILLYFFTNLVNPFIYCATMKDFRLGYKNILLCKTTKKNQNQQIDLAVIELEQV